MESISELKDKHAVRRGLQSRCPSNWPRVKLGEVATEIRDRINSSQISIEQYVTTENMVKDRGGVVVADSMPNDAGLVRYGIGDVLIANIRPYLKKIWLSNCEGGCSSDVVVYRASTSELSSEYLHSALSSDDFFNYVMRKTRGTKMPRGDRDWMLQFEIPLPPLAVQHEIVARLEKDLAMVERMAKGFEALKTEADQLFKSTLKEIGLYENDWPLEPLKNHVDVLAGYAFKSDDFSGDGVKICGGLIIMPDRIKWEECKYLSNPIGYEQFLLNEGDIVLALDRPWISSGFKMGRIKKTDLPCLLIQRTARLRVIDMDRGFLSIALLHENFRDHCTTSGTTVPHISHKDIESYLVPFPPLPAQRKIVAKLDAVRERCEKLKRAAEEGLQTAALMRKAILKEAFA